MPAPTVGHAPSLNTFLKSLKTKQIESSIELLVSLLKRRQIKHSRPCAIATARLLFMVVADNDKRWRNTDDLIERIRDVGRRLQLSQPREMAVGNIVRRVLGVVREVAEDVQGRNSTDGNKHSLPTPALRNELPHRPNLPTTISGSIPQHQGGSQPQSMRVSTNSSSPSLDGAARRPGMPGAAATHVGTQATSLFGIFKDPQGTAPMSTPLVGSENREKVDIKAEVITGIKELIEELDIVDGQIAESALDHIHSNETILTYSSSQTVQKFLATAARKRKFTVIVAEAYPNDYEETHDTIVNGGVKAGEDEDGGERWKPLTEMGIKVIVIADMAVFGLMSRINKVIISPHTVLANGSLFAAAGTSTIVLAAQMHRVPVVVLTGVYKLSPVFTVDSRQMIEYGDPSKVIPFQDGDFMDKVNVINPLNEHVEADLVDLYITNLGGHAPSYLYKIIEDHYRPEDINIFDDKPEDDGSADKAAVSKPEGDGSADKADVSKPEGDGTVDKARVSKVEDWLVGIPQ